MGVKLGRCNLETGRISLGTVKFGRNTDVKYPAKFELPEDKLIVNLLGYLILHQPTVTASIELVSYYPGAGRTGSSAQKPANSMPPASPAMTFPGRR